MSAATVFLVVLRTHEGRALCLRQKYRKKGYSSVFYILYYFPYHLGHLSFSAMLNCLSCCNETYFYCYDTYVYIILKQQNFNNHSVCQCCKKSQKSKVKVKTSCWNSSWVKVKVTHVNSTKILWYQMYF